MLERSGKSGNMGDTNLMIARSAIVLGMVAAVATIIYFTPVPNQNFKSCDRPCHDLDWPMICRVTLNIEMFQTNLICEDCHTNSSSCVQTSCPTPATTTTTRSIITVNRQLPAPPIHVCHNDILIIDVANRIEGHTLSLHWRGQPNHEAPFMDGVPLVTQCPISSYTTFQYKFRASSPGTHLYHAYSDADRSNGLFGALVVRRAKKTEPLRKLYDVDDDQHVVLLSEWTDSSKSLQSPSSILINGKGPNGSLTSFIVTKGKRHRFRVAHTGGIKGCPITVSIDNHLLKVVAVDGNPINAQEVSSITLSKGERLDFVLKANQAAGAHYLRASSTCDGKEISGGAIVSYLGTSDGVTVGKKLGGMRDPRRFRTSFCGNKDGDVCLGAVRSMEKMAEELGGDVDRKFYIGFDHIHKDVEFDQTGFTSVRMQVHRLNNISFTFPPCPLLTQPGDVPLDLMCNEFNLPDRCKGKDTCECVHLEHIPLGSRTEIVLIDESGDEEEHIFHLHGHQFYVLGSRIFDKPLARADVRKLDQENKLLKRNLMHPVLKDTIRVPRNGVVVIRFLANNPGFWMLRDEKSEAWTRGMDIAFQVGELADVVSTPTAFPTCGNFIGPQFFLV
ncbi:unnamed protein product [Phaedon cochleariae]|uniref:Multicopper oxidase n=1 Tax=Phaedon cochleariae TaxID=80249 RepID=A0A9N9SBZ6_PHACE|nr:unnamed protein product [Phaedon cochleariae]